MKQLQFTCCGREWFMVPMSTDEFGDYYVIEDSARQPVGCAYEADERDGRWCAHRGHISEIDTTENWTDQGPVSAATYLIEALTTPEVKPRPPEGRPAAAVAGPGRQRGDGWISTTRWRRRFRRLPVGRSGVPPVNDCNT